MDKTAIKNFAIWARNKLIADSVYKASLLGISEKGIENPLPQSTADTQLFDIGIKEPYTIAGQEIGQRKKLVEAIKNKQRDLKYKDAFQNVMEEVAYTWFNRLVAIRFMEVNDYLPSHIRVLSSENPGKTEPDLVTTPFDSDLSFNNAEKQQIIDLKNENRIDDLFRMLLIKQCNALNGPLPMLFEKISDYTELLLNVSVTDRDGIVWHLVHDIPEDNFNVNAIGEDGQPIGQVEIIGWLYQYYNTEPKDKVFANLKKNIKITKETIPAATQLFTPDWIVRYMVENSLGRLWIEGHTNEELKANWKYYLDEAEQEEDVQKQLDQIYAEHAKLKPEDITCMDPCCGSGHILVYMFEVLMQIYQSQGYSAREAAVSIVEHNIYGLDIDKRAAQLAYFAVMMKARQYDRRFLTRGIQPNVYAICESNGISEDCIQYFSNGEEKINREIRDLTNQMKDACEYGSILQVSQFDFYKMGLRYKEIQQDINFYRQEVEEDLYPLIKVSNLLSKKYSIVVTNPPYMNSSGMDSNLSDYIKEHYQNSKGDLFAVFIERCGAMTKKSCYQAMITQHSWMFLASFEKIRNIIIQKSIINMAHLGPRAFEEIGGEIVQTTSFVIRNTNISNYYGKYCRLVDQTNQNDKETMFLSHKKIYISNQLNFNMIPGHPVAYWASKQIVDAFDGNMFIKDHGETKKGVLTGNDQKFVRLWFEVSLDKIGFGIKDYSEMIKINKKWIPATGGGQYRKWYGNFENIIDMENDSYDIKYRNKNNYRLRDSQYYFKECSTWSEVSGKGLSVRYVPQGILFGNSGPVCFWHDNEFYWIALLNSKVSTAFLYFLSPTLTFGPEQLQRIPCVNGNKDQLEAGETLSKENIAISKEDWDAYETSFEYIKDPIIKMNERLHCETIEECYFAWKNECNDNFYKLKQNEEKLNKIFIDSYGLTDELEENESEDSVSVHYVIDTTKESHPLFNGSLYLITKKEIVKNFISYIVGCLFGRYSFDIEGIACAGGNWNDLNYKTILPDKDNVLPITDEEYLDDDIVGRFVNCIKIVFGEKNLEENLTFLAETLDGKGKSSREVIRNYFLKDFFKDHCKTYQKHPIYWLYDSGKQNGFKALVYLHRMDENTTGKVRADYLHKMEQIYTNEVARMQDTIDHSNSAHEVSVAEKRMDKLKKQIKECQEYDAKLGHLALDQIKLNLDDGVKVNYRKAQTGRDGKFYEVLADSKNLMANDALWHEYLTEWPHEDE
ncbi:MAG: BREX-1 system adenine-specific DNA-methyltransferase PglX [Pyramidobacter sp.]